jgi:hypothetical protein
MQYPERTSFSQYFTHLVETHAHVFVVSFCRCCSRLIAFAPVETNLEIAEIAHFKRCDEIAQRELQGES